VGHRGREKKLQTIRLTKGEDVDLAEGRRIGPHVGYGSEYLTAWHVDELLPILGVEAAERAPARAGVVLLDEGWGIAAERLYELAHAERFPKEASIVLDSGTLDHEKPVNVAA